ncbi:MAG TPA: FtsX-like permease family protein [Actinomycetota bacterium]|nr:FtsX-like permease family protein [Actinomycetota bacterium]
MRGVWFWLRWAARDLRARWPQVAAIALIVAVGTGVSAGLGSMTAWRQVSYDESYALLRAHDIRVDLPEGSTVAAGTLLDAVAGLSGVAVAEERLVTPTQVDASRGNRTLLVPGALIGVDVARGGPRIDRLHVTGGRSLTVSDVTTPGVVLERHFADVYDLPPSGEVGLPGGVRIPYVGTMFTPEYFMVTTESGSFLAESNFAVVVAPLLVAQRLAGAEGLVNDLVVRLEPGVDRDAAKTDVANALHDALPSLAASITTIEEDPAYMALYGDMENDQRTMDAVALLIFGAAVLAAFNLTSRIVEAKRRELGVGMALGQRRWTIALRPMLMALEVALLGVVFGIGVGLLVAVGLRDVLESLLPMPVFRTSFQADEFVEAAALGLLLPIVATLWPVWRAIRVPPVAALRTGHLAVRSGVLSPFLKKLTPHGTSLRLMPLRNILRAPRRTILTAIGLGAAISAMVGVVGGIDSFNATIDAGVQEVRSGAPDRLQVELTGIVPVSEGTVEAIAMTPGVQDATPSLRMGGQLLGQEDTPSIDVILEVLDLENDVWHPTIRQAVPSSHLPGIVLAEEAAHDLGLTPGDVLKVRHPVIEEGATSFGSIEEPMRVVGVHPYPIRSFAYLDDADAGRFGRARAANVVMVAPSTGTDVEALKRSLFELPGVASAQAADASAAALQDLMERFTGILRFLELFVLLLALLIAFNASAISVDERARDHATMFAFGVRPLAVLRGLTVEALLVGFLGTSVGLGLGVLAVRWIVSGAASDMPDIGMIVSIAPSTIVTTIALGVLAVGAAPLFTFRRLRRMDVPSTLRVME